MRAVEAGSRALAGSSSSNTSGLVASARAMHNRWAWPPERAMAESFRRSLTSFQRAARFRQSSQTSSRTRRSFWPATLWPKITFSKMLLGNGLDFWKTMPTRLRSETRSKSRPLMSRPSSATTPSWRELSTKSFMRLRLHRKVLLPQPEGPMRAITLRSGMVRLMEYRACLAPYQKFQSRTSNLVVRTAPSGPRPVRDLSCMMRENAVEDPPAIDASPKLANPRDDPGGPGFPQ